MVKIGLNFICKNESHVILRMLQSVAPIVDIIVAVDTGSTDNTIELIQQFGHIENIPTYVFERPFDDFASSRNFALTKLINIAVELKWDLATSWGLSIDCDEKMIISPKFNKNELNSDFYRIKGTDREIVFTRDSFFKLAASPIWEGPIHECLKIVQGSTTTLKGLYFECYPEGASWKGDLPKKFIHYADRLIQYVSEGHRNRRWLYYIGESYGLAAEFSPLRARENLLTKALFYFEQAINLESEDKTFFLNAQFKLCLCKIEMGHEASEIIDLLLQTYALDYTNADSIFILIQYYVKHENWEDAYLFSSFSKKHFHSSIPISNLSFITNLSIYHWQLLYYHYLVSYNTGRKRESRELYKQLKMLILGKPPFYSKKIELEIRACSPSILTILKFIRFFHKLKINLNITKDKKNRNSVDLNMSPE